MSNTDPKDPPPPENESISIIEAGRLFEGMMNDFRTEIESELGEHFDAIPDADEFIYKILQSRMISVILHERFTQRFPAEAKQFDAIMLHLHLHDAFTKAITMSAKGPKH